MGAVNQKQVGIANAASVVLVAVSLLVCSKYSQAGMALIWKSTNKERSDWIASPPVSIHWSFRLPEGLRFGSTKGSTRNWGANFFTYYPSFTEFK